jgi:hypothetical protein
MAHMSSHPLKMNWPYIAFVVLVAGGALGFIGWAVMTQSESNRIGMWEIGVACCCLVMFAAVLWKLYGDWKTTITDEAVTRRSPVGTRTIHWAEVTEATIFNGYGIHVHDSNGKIVISPYAYRDPERVFERVRTCLAASLFLAER